MGLSFSRMRSRLAGLKDTRLLMLGLDAAGKTTILYKLQLGETISTVPTIGFNVETVEYKNLRMVVWDVGGQFKKVKELWRPYYKGTHGLIFVIDSSDRHRIDEAREELHAMVNKDELRKAVVLVYANKQDLPHAMTTTEVTEKLRLGDLRGRQWFVQSTCAITAEGIYEGLNWFNETLLKRA